MSGYSFGNKETKFATLVYKVITLVTSNFLFTIVTEIFRCEWSDSRSTL